MHKTRMAGIHLFRFGMGVLRLGLCLAFLLFVNYLESKKHALWACFYVVDQAVERSNRTHRHRTKEHQRCAVTHYDRGRAEDAGLISVGGTLEVQHSESHRGHPSVARRCSSSL